MNPMQMMMRQMMGGGMPTGNMQGRGIAGILGAANEVYGQMRRELVDQTDKTPFLGVCGGILDEPILGGHGEITVFLIGQQGLQMFRLLFVEIT